MTALVSIGYPLGMQTRHQPNLSSTSVAFLASLLGHGLVLLYLSVFTQPPPSPPSAQQGEVVPLLSKQQVDQLLRRSKRLPRHPKEEKKEEEKEKDQTPPKGQVVDIPPPENQDKPKDARFLAEFNSAVERELVHVNTQSPQPKMTRSARRSMSGGDDLRGVRKGKLGARRARTRTSSVIKKRSHTKQRRTERSQPDPARKPERRVVVDGEGPFKRTLTEKELQSTARGAQRGALTGGDQRPIAPTHYRGLLPTLGPQDLERLEGSIDHVLNVPKGNKTALNTREYRFAHFFNRVKREVSARWRAIEVYRAHDPRGEVYGVQDRQTVLNVTLDASGALAGIEVLQSSGVRALDLEAIEAFKRAQPFYHPPKGLADPDGKIRFKFGFFLEINGGGFRFLP